MRVLATRAAELASDEDGRTIPVQTLRQNNFELLLRGMLNFEDDGAIGRKQTGHGWKDNHYLEH